MECAYISPQFTIFLISHYLPSPQTQVIIANHSLYIRIVCFADWARHSPLFWARYGASWLLSGISVHLIYTCEPGMVHVGCWVVFWDISSKVVSQVWWHFRTSQPLLWVRNGASWLLSGIVGHLIHTCEAKSWTSLTPLQITLSASHRTWARWPHCSTKWFYNRDHNIIQF